MSAPLLSFDSPPISTSLPSNTAGGMTLAATTNPAFTSSEGQRSSAAARNVNMQQHGPKPLINFANNMSPSNNNNNMHRDNILSNTEDTDSYFSDADNEPIIPRTALRHPLIANRLSTTQAELFNVNTVNGRKSITPPPGNFALNNHIKSSSPPASSSLVGATTITTDAVPTVSSSKNLMDRMKERHRQEVRRSLNGSPFLENQTVNAARKNLSSPSMPLIFSAANSDPIQNNPNGSNAGGIITSSPITTRIHPRPLVQSHSFTTSVKSPSTPLSQRQLGGHLVRSASTINDIYSGSFANASNPIQVSFIFISYFDDQVDTHTPLPTDTVRHKLSKILSSSSSFTKIPSNH